MSDHPNRRRISSFFLKDSKGDYTFLLERQAGIYDIGLTFFRNMLALT